MYNVYFGFSEAPFSIAPDPRYLYLSEQHREALAHLVYGMGDQGGFVVLTGEVGTGKTTVCRCLLQQVPDHVDVAVVVNPRQSPDEILQTICSELGVALPEGDLSSKQLIDALNDFLLETHARGRNAILIVDEAQNLSIEVLEQLRLLTNLETNERKLLQLILLGQPELNDMLARSDLRQLAQRITARYHLQPLTLPEVGHYITHRLAVAGYRGTLFTDTAVRQVARLSQGVPRLINVLCDRALLGAYASNLTVVDHLLVRQAAREVLPRNGGASSARDTLRRSWGWLKGRRALPYVAGVLVVVSALVGYLLLRTPASDSELPAARAGWLESFASTPATMPAALASLRAWWGVNGPVVSCDITDAALPCTELQGLDRAALQRFDVPLVLSLMHPEWPAPRYLVLQRLRGDLAHVRFESREWQVSWAAVDELWNGVALIAVPAPLAQLPLTSGGEGPLVSWVDQHLYQHYQGGSGRWQQVEQDLSDKLGSNASKAAWLSSQFLALHPQPLATVYGPELEAVVRQFQAEQGLSDDGVLDLETVVALARETRAAGKVVSDAGTGTDTDAVKEEG